MTKCSVATVNKMTRIKAARKLITAAKKLSAGNFDPSVLGVRKEDLAEMGPDERQEEMVDAIFRAADLIEAIDGAFEQELGEWSSKLKQAAKILKDLGHEITS